MHKDKYIFAQLVSFLDRSKFNRIVQKYDGDKYVKSFTRWNQLLVMMFAQLIKQDGLCRPSLTIESLGPMCYHLGVIRSTLSKVTHERDRCIFDEFAYFVVNVAREKRVWQVELSFKWLKQHLRIKKFWGTNENAVRIQINSAITAYCKVTIVQNDLHIDKSIYYVLQIMD